MMNIRSSSQSNASKTTKKNWANIRYSNAVLSRRDRQEGWKGREEEMRDDVLPQLLLFVARRTKGRSKHMVRHARPCKSKWNRPHNSKNHHKNKECHKSGKSMTRKDCTFSGNKMAKWGNLTDRSPVATRNTQRNAAKPMWQEVKTDRRSALPITIPVHSPGSD